MMLVHSAQLIPSPFSALEFEPCTPPLDVPYHITFLPNSTRYRAIFRLRAALATPRKRIIESTRPVQIIRRHILPLEFAIPGATMVKRGE